MGLPYIHGANGAQINALCAAQGMPSSDRGDLYQQRPAGCRRRLGQYGPQAGKGGHVHGRRRLSADLGHALAAERLDFGGLLQYPVEERDLGNRFEYDRDSCFNLNGGNPTYAASNYFCSLLNRSPVTGVLANSSAPYENLGQDKTSGVDIEADWLTDIGEATGWGPDAGTMSVDFVGSYLNDFKQQTLPGGSFQEQGGTDINNTGGPYPTWRTNTTFTYHNWGADIGLRWRFIGGMRDSSIITNPASIIMGQHPLSYFDLNLGYTLKETDTRLSLVVSNLFATDPQEVGGIPGNTIAGLYSPLGRLYLLTLDQKF